MTPNVMTRLYRKGTLADDAFPLAQVSDYLEEADTVVWVDLCEPTRHQLDQLVEEFDLHVLAVEDALEPHQRPKLDHYDTHLFMSCEAVRLDKAKGTLDETEIDAFIGKRWLITVRRSEKFSIEGVLQRWHRSPDLAQYGVGFLVYGLLDVIVDDYFDAVSTFDEYYEELGDGIFAERPLEPSQQRNWFEMRRASVRFHRLVIATREAISSLMRREQALVPEELYPYYQDLYDHILRVSESSDSLRDLVGMLVETNLSLRDYRQNLIVKKVSSWAAIVAVPALITGYYGMNVPYPGYGTVAGAIWSGVLIVAMTIALYVLFRRNDWL